MIVHVDSCQSCLIGTEGGKETTPTASLLPTQVFVNTFSIFVNRIPPGFEQGIDKGQQPFVNTPVNPGAIQRVTYILAGQSIAIHVTGDPAPNNNGFFFILSDHLGSTSLLSTTGGSVVSGSTSRYMPFGAFRGTAPSQSITDRTYTGHEANNLGSGNTNLGLIYMNARFYSPSSGRFITADTIIPNPTNPQSFNRYSYTRNNPPNFTDPSGHSCVDALEGYPAEQYDCLAEGVPPLVFYLNGLGGAEDYPRTANTNNEYNFLLYVLSLMSGEENVVHIPLFTEPYRWGTSHLDMIGESLGIGANQTQFAVEQIEQHLIEYPLEPGQQLVLVGSSAGGTVAVETLDLLEERGIYVDQIILRGSFVQEFSLDNVGRVDYIAADPPLSDWRNYSFDINPFDNVSVNEHLIPGFSGHVPQTARQQRQIAGMVVDLIIDAAVAR